MKLWGFKNFGDIEGKIVDGATLKNAFDEHKKEILEKYSMLCYQLKLDKKDVSKFDFGKFIQSYNGVLEELTSGKFINVSDSKTHDIKYKKYQFVHSFITHGKNIVPDAVTIKFRPFDEISYFHSCCMLNDNNADESAMKT